MSRDPDRRRADREPRGLVPHRPAGAAPRWRRAVALLFGAREDIDQEGLLAERTMRLPPPRGPRRDDDEHGHEAPTDEHGRV
jgi:hypothetical protein